jgi:hypothetical protein
MRRDAVDAVEDYLERAGWPSLAAMHADRVPTYCYDAVEDYLFWHHGEATLAEFHASSCTRHCAHCGKEISSERFCCSRVCHDRAAIDPLAESERAET